LQRSKFSFF